MRKSVKRLVRNVADTLLVPLVYPAAALLKFVRKQGVMHLPLCKKALLNVGVFPIRNHYYEPQFDMANAKLSFSDPRSLPGIDWNISEQLFLLEKLVFGMELETTPRGKTAALEFYMDNGTFESGDAEYWYQMIRLNKPKRIFEVGSGNSTLMAVKASRQNRAEDPSYECKHVCIEPFEMPWLERLGISVIREKVEDVGLAFFQELDEGDILFIDSSHVVRPQGDVLFEYLELLPSLRKGVLVHVHDIFSPRNYPAGWLADEVRFWTEQYLLEAFLTHNGNWKIVGALNYLHHDHHDELKQVCPFLTRTAEPGSFYIQKVV